MSRFLLLAFFAYAVEAATPHHECICFPPRSVPQTAFCSNYELTEVRGCRPFRIFGLNPLGILESTIGSDSFANRHHYDLQVVRLDHNRLKEISGNIFGDLTKLEEVDLSHNIIKKRIPPETFEKNTKLRSINISHNNLGLTAARPIVVSQTAEILRATNCGFLLIDSSTFELPKLRKLNLSTNNINVFETASLSSFAKISNLDLSFNNIDISSVNFSVAANLAFLDLSHNHLVTNKSLPLLSNGYLKTLNVSGCGLKTITNETFNTPLLNVLNVSENEIEFLEENPFILMPLLNSLDLSMNKIKNLDFFLDIPDVNLFGNPWICDCEYLNPHMTSSLFYNAICFDSESFTGLPVSKFHNGDYCFQIKTTYEDRNLQTTTIETSTFSMPQTERFSFINTTEVLEALAFQEGTDISIPIITVVFITMSVCGILACQCIVTIIRAYRRRNLSTEKNKSIHGSELSIAMYEQGSYDRSDKNKRRNSPKPQYLHVRQHEHESNHYTNDPTENDYEEIEYFQSFSTKTQEKQ